MESKPSGPVVLTAEEEAVLKEGIYLELSQWTAMKAAVDNGWGGRDSHEKANRTLSNVVDYFIHLKDPTTGFDGLADILENGLYELNTVADDGSLEEIGIMNAYQRLEKLRATSSQRRASVVKVSNGNDEDDEESDEDDEDEDTNMNDDQTTDMMVDASEQKPEAMPVDEPKADDGWTTVPSRKNKGKRRN
uniref:Pre-rRNA-processing protein TSR2 n=1 Tax=Brassica campestris TaxID=3711 RepID=M4D0I6_BRACM